MESSFLDILSEERREVNMICSGLSVNFIGDGSS